MFTAGVHGLLSNLINHSSTTKKQHFCHQLILATKCDEPQKVWDFASYWAMRWLDGITDLMHIEFEQAPGVSDGQGALVCCSWWGCKESDTTEWLNWTVTLSQVYRCRCKPVIFLGQRQRTSYSQHSQHHEYQHFVTEVYAHNRLCHMRVPEVREPRSFIKGNRHFYWQT